MTVYSIQAYICNDPELLNACQQQLTPFAGKLSAIYNTMPYQNACSCKTTMTKVRVIDGWDTSNQQPGQSYISAAQKTFLVTHHSKLVVSCIGQKVDALTSSHLSSVAESKSGQRWGRSGAHLFNGEREERDAGGREQDGTHSKAEGREP